MQLFYDSLFSFEAFYAPLLRQQILNDVYRHLVNWLVNWPVGEEKRGLILCDENVVKCVACEIGEGAIRKKAEILYRLKKYPAYRYTLMSAVHRRGL